LKERKREAKKTVREDKKGNVEEKENSGESWPASAVVSDCAGGRFGEQEVQQTPAILIFVSISARLEQTLNHTSKLHKFKSESYILACCSLYQNHIHIGLL